MQPKVMCSSHSVQPACPEENPQMALPARKPTASYARTVSTAAPSGRAEPFRDAEAAWFWTMAALRARHEGARYTANQGKVSRPCEPDDVVKCLDQLYRRRRIDLVHARILR